MVGGWGDGAGVTAERDSGLLGCWKGFISSSGCWFILGKFTEAYADDLGTFRYTYITRVKNSTVKPFGDVEYKNQTVLRLSTHNMPSPVGTI